MPTADETQSEDPAQLAEQGGIAHGNKMSPDVQKDQEQADLIRAGVIAHSNKLSPDVQKVQEQAVDLIRAGVPERGIGSRIALARERFGLTQTKLAERTKRSDPEGRGVPRTVLIGYESGKFLPGARELRVLCEALELDIVWLLYGYEDLTKEESEREEATRLLRYPGLDLQFELAISIARLKKHEQEAIATLVHGIISRSNRSEDEAKAIRSIAQDVVRLMIDLFWKATGRETAMSDFMANLMLGREVSSFAQALHELTAEMAIPRMSPDAPKPRKGIASSEPPVEK